MKLSFYFSYIFLYPSFFFELEVFFLFKKLEVFIKEGFTTQVLRYEPIQQPIE